MGLQISDRERGKSSNIATYSKRGGDCMIGNYILLDHFGDKNVTRVVSNHKWSSNTYNKKIKEDLEEHNRLCLKNFQIVQ
jgi:hypothetical protein